MRTLKLIARFFRGTFLINLTVTLVGVYAIAANRSMANKLIGTFFWGKLVILGFVTFYTMTAKRKELYYYQNLGISRIRLITPMILFDFLLWVMLMTIAYIL